MMLFAADQHRTVRALSPELAARLRCRRLRRAGLYGVLAPAAVVFSLFGVAIGGVKYFMSGGDSSNISSAKNTAIYAVSSTPLGAAVAWIILGPLAAVAVVGNSVLQFSLIVGLDAAARAFSRRRWQREAPAFAAAHAGAGGHA